MLFRLVKPLPSAGIFLTTSVLLREGGDTGAIKRRQKLSQVFQNCLVSQQNVWSIINTHIPHKHSHYTPAVSSCLNFADKVVKSCFSLFLSSNTLTRTTSLDNQKSDKKGRKNKNRKSNSDAKHDPLF